MTLFANTAPSWLALGAWTVLILWLLVQVLAILVSGYLILRVHRLVTRMTENERQASADRLQALEDRKLTRELLVTVKGWTALVDVKDSRKEDQLREVAKVAARTAVEVKAAIETAASIVTEATASRVMEKIEEKASGESGLGIPKPVLPAPS